MNYIELINKFWELDEIWQFSCCETRLYFYLLKIANRLSWENDWTHSDDRTAANVGVSNNSMKNARNRLIQAGLIAIKAGGKGYRDKTRYQILKPNELPKMQPIATPIQEGRHQRVNKQKTKQKIITPVTPPTGEETFAQGEISEKDFIDEVVKLFNETCPGMNPVKVITEKRRESIMARFREHGRENVFEMIRKAGASKFLTGQSKSGFMANFDWIFRPTNFVKTLEGNYDDREKAQNGNDSIEQGKRNLYDRIKQAAANSAGVPGC